MINEVDYEQKNLLLCIYSKPSGNCANKLMAYMQKNNLTNYQTIVHEFDAIEEKLFNYIWEITKPNLKLTGLEIKLEAQKFCNHHYDWIKPDGLESLTAWLVWMCWHEGILTGEM